MDDGRAGEHPLEHRLGNRQPGAADESQDGEESNDMIADESGIDVEDQVEAQGDSEKGDFENRRHEHRHREGRTKVNIKQPGVERHRPDLEKDRDHDEETGGA